MKIHWDKRAALGVVMASRGYPESASKGDIISGLQDIDNENTKVFHAATALANEAIVTAGGRVLCVTALGESVSKAQQLAYSAAAKIHCAGMFYRKDIGYRAVDREKSPNNQ